MSTSLPLFSFHDCASTRRILGCLASLLLLASTTHALPLVVGEFGVSVGAAVPAAGTLVSDSQTNVPWNTGSSALLATATETFSISAALTYDLVNPDNAASATFSLNTDARFTGDARTIAVMTALFSVTAPVTYTISGSFEGYVNQAAANTETLLTESTGINTFLYRESEGRVATRDDDAFLFNTNLLNDGNLPSVIAGSPTGILLPGVIYRLDLGYQFTPRGGDSWATGFSRWSVSFDRIGSGPTDPPSQNVPDSASTASLLGGTLLAACFLQRWKPLHRSSLA
jgi:hypothetical protein